MLTLNINCKSQDEKANLCYRICESLKGSPAFVSNEIVVSDDDAEHTAVTVLVGDQNSHDVMFDLDAENLYEVKDQEQASTKEPIIIVYTAGMYNVIDDPHGNIGLYLMLSHKAGEPILVACDNSTGEAWIEEFYDIKAAMNWLRRG
nr:MAG TPA: hypothetical protein [Caudoviricetes sp.]